MRQIPGCQVKSYITLGEELIEYVHSTSIPSFLFHGNTLKFSWQLDQSLLIGPVDLPVFLIGTAILIFRYFAPYLPYHYTSLVIIGNCAPIFFLLNLDKLISQKLGNYVKRSFKSQAHLKSMDKLNFTRRKFCANRAKCCTTLNKRNIVCARISTVKVCTK